MPGYPDSAASPRVKVKRTMGQDIGYAGISAGSAAISAGIPERMGTPGGNKDSKHEVLPAPDRDVGSAWVTLPQRGAKYCLAGGWVSAITHGRMFSRALEIATVVSAV
jgi:hypothetical protein